MGNVLHSTKIQRFTGASQTKVDHIKARGGGVVVPASGGSSSKDDKGSRLQEVAPPAGHSSSLVEIPPVSSVSASTKDVERDESIEDITQQAGMEVTTVVELQGQTGEPKGPGLATPNAEAADEEKTQALLLPQQTFENPENRKVSQRGQVSMRVGRGGGDHALLAKSNSAELQALGSGQGFSRCQSTESRMSARLSLLRPQYTSERPLRDDIRGKPAVAVGSPFPKRPLGCKLSAKTWAKLEELFRLMDTDGSNAVTREEAQAFFKGAYSNVSADAMFNEVDVDRSGAITAEEFVEFWIQVRKAGYKEQDILDEVNELIEGGTWVDWEDGRDTGPAKRQPFPKRPLLCRLSASLWKQCQELFLEISGEDMQITRDKAHAFFKGSFSRISADAMFNEIDVKHHGVITPKEWMNFWVQVKASGYKEKDIKEEIVNLLDGNPWVDWKDGRTT